MRKQEQILINEKALAIWEKACAELYSDNGRWFYEFKAISKNRLRSCTAWVYETTNYYLLKSYGTFIACIEKSSDTCVDVLRYEYGYTSTSAQHIAKFRHDYGSGKWGCEHELRYYSV
ncbi:MAG: hypothetical protein J6R32_00960 [Bacteroidales bacterium]|nr:hypothetical protein [Bacteroidales bacterium]